MQAFVSRAGRWPLALTIAALGACSDDPAARTLAAPQAPNLTVADPFTVINTNDSGIGSLRWVLSYTTGGEVIRFDPSIAGQTITLDSTMHIRRSVTIEGPAAGITINGGGHGRVFMARFSGAVTLRNLAVTGGNSPVGAGVVMYGEADVTLENTLLYGNHGDAGIAIVAGNVTLVNSTVTGTTKAGTGTFDYPAIMGDTVTLINSTVSHNGWGGVGSFNGLVTLRNSIVSHNAGKNCVIVSPATLRREGANVSDDDTCGGPGEIIIADPKLGGLNNNGGPTMTHALLAGSPAINAGTSCSVTVDQRYVPRDAQCDLGAFEFIDPTTVTLTIDPGVAVNQSNGWAVVTGTVQCSRNETFSVAVQLEQQQRTGRGTTTVDAAAIVPVDCTTSVRPWIASMVLTSGQFDIGAGDVKAQTVNTAAWVTPASASAQVRMYWGRRTE